MDIKWRDIKLEQPEDGQHVLTVMKHGIISGYWDRKDGACSGYYWCDITWHPSHWVPVEEVQP